MVWRIPAEQFSSSNDPCYCLRVDGVHREPEDFHIILIIVATTIIIIPDICRFFYTNKIFGE